VTAPQGDVFWYQGARPHGAPLERDLSVDVAVVGGGMAGLTCAQALSDGGLSVAILEKSFCGAGASGKSSGFITPASELELSELTKNLGTHRARELWAFAEGGVELIRSNIREYGIACDYQEQDSLLVAADDRGARQAADEHRARTLLGYRSTHYEKEDLPRVLGTTAFGGGVRYPGTFGIDSYRYCRGMRDVLVARGVLVFENTLVTEGPPGEVRALGHKVSAGHVILCADRCIPDLSPLENQIGQIQTFLAISQPLRDDQVRRVFPAAPVMTWDSKLTYNYFRLTGEQRLLVGGANLWHAYALRERHDPVRSLRRLSAFVDRVFPGLDVPWDHVWPGMLGVSKDFLPVAGTDAGISSLTYIGAAAGLPWAAALGRQVGRSILSGATDTFPEFSPYRRAVRGALLNRVLTRRGALALAHARLVARSL
jgi:gamma-glutamylputrescine oxidase